ncbi:MAG: NAD(P) transhydrogenase subunit beta [Deltaproteobacteria bacterium HGW-Deltaproteobacteria-14]|jgi:NAD(P) transhydrogenase subunit beta|nr:MAG: NAD(P) transhydrogenase subunit beta [Deltaproteobacteria bacterium HGW-Deltaproteobacteria-14]
MNQDVLLALSYIVASVLFIMSLRGLSSQETARRGNLYGMIGMALAIVATFLDGRVDAYFMLIPAVAAGALVGIWLAIRVAMTAMPELVAMLHSFVGAAAVLVGMASYLGHSEGPHDVVHLIEVYIDIFIGAITFTGSIIAFLKLRGSLSGRPLLLPGRHLLNLALVLGSIGLAIPFVGGEGATGLVPMLIMTGLAGLLGIHMVMAIGGADMPVVVSLLNSYSGWTAAAAGFMLGNDLLIVTGALVGSSGAILSVIMCRAMNRSIWNVVFSGFGAQAGVAKPTSDGDGPTEIFEIDVDGTVAELMQAKQVIIVPGYGMAVARAQHAVRELTNLLREHGARVRFGIHPVAGRLPGHMNVLLAEANIPYDIVLEMDEINDDFAETDVVLVIGANDIVNPAAKTDESSTIYGMPVLEVWDAKRVVMMKRGRSAGYAGIDNPLFYLENTRMLFGDAKATVDSLVTELRQQAQAEAA